MDGVGVAERLGDHLLGLGEEGGEGGYGVG